MLYPAPGNIVDWMYGEMGVKFSFAIHLRDTGTVWIVSSLKSLRVDVLNFFCGFRA